MKSIIKSITRTEKQAQLVFRLDAKLLANIEKVFKKLEPRFKLSDFRKYNGEKWLTDFYESTGKDKLFNFTIIIKNDTLRLKLKASLKSINQFLKSILDFAEFAER